MDSYIIPITSFAFLVVNVGLLIKTVLSSNCDASVQPLLDVRYEECFRAKLTCGQVLRPSNCLASKPKVTLPGYTPSEGDQFFIVMFELGNNAANDTYLCWVEQNIPGSHIARDSNSVPNGTTILSYQAPAPMTGVHKYLIYIHEQLSDVTSSQASAFERQISSVILVLVLELLDDGGVLSDRTAAFQFVVNAEEEIATAVPSITTARGLTSRTPNTVSTIVTERRSTKAPTTTATGEDSAVKPGSGTTKPVEEDKNAVPGSVTPEPPIEEEIDNVFVSQRVSDEREKFPLWLIPVLAAAGVMFIVFVSLTICKLQEEDDDSQTDDFATSNAEDLEVASQYTTYTAGSNFADNESLKSKATAASIKSGATGASFASGATGASFASGATGASFASGATGASNASGASVATSRTNATDNS